MGTSGSYLLCPSFVIAMYVTNCNNTCYKFKYQYLISYNYHKCLLSNLICKPALKTLKLFHSKCKIISDNIMININNILECAALCLANRRNNRKTNVPIVEGYFMCWRGLSYSALLCDQGSFLTVLSISFFICYLTLSLRARLQGGQLNIRILEPYLALSLTSTRFVVHVVCSSASY